jgi:S-adenosylmethionine hydrolase
MSAMPIITLLTDFGLRDGYPGIMKGVIYQIAPTARIADITHFISPQNIREGALALSRSCRYFPAGTIHVAVVDPGVGTDRRPMAMQLGEHFFVGPDNGLFSQVVQEARLNGWTSRFIVCNRQQFWLPEPSRVFHGRDIFAPVAAHLASGVKLEAIGDPIYDPFVMPDLLPQPIESGWQGQVIAIDHFGNLSTNILDEHLKDCLEPEIHIAGQVVHGLVQTFGDRPTGELIALIGTDHDLSISIVNGSAQTALNVEVGADILVTTRAV